MNIHPEDCVHGDDPQLCPPCVATTHPWAPEVGADHQAYGTWTATMRARLEGDCPECREPIRTGDYIRKRDDAKARWMHEACARTLA